MFSANYTHFNNNNNESFSAPKLSPGTYKMRVCFIYAELSASAALGYVIRALSRMLKIGMNKSSVKRFVFFVRRRCKQLNHAVASETWINESWAMLRWMAMTMRS